MDLQGHKFQHIAEAAEKAVKEIDKRRLGLIKPYVTKWKKFNTMLGGGLQKGTVYVVGGRPGLGKSAFTNRLIFDVCYENALSNTAILYWNFEMPNYSQVIRETSHIMQKSVGGLMSGIQPLEESSFNFLKGVAERFREYPIYFQSETKTPEYVYRTNVELKAANPDKHFINIFDHTRLASKSGKQGETEEEKIKDLLAVGRQLSVDSESTFIFLSQLNRNIETPDRAANGYVPQLTDYFGADAVGQFAHVGMILQRPEMYNLGTYLNERAKNLLACHILEI